ncbi:MAG: hypothetical protein CL489_17655 [Acidobacteria bacterium]|nr:hypothetical protein [Acidobacteriota bacterium]
MKKLFKVGKEFFEKKADAKTYRNKLEGYTPTLDKDGKYPLHKWKHEIKRGPDHWKGESK